MTTFSGSSTPVVSQLGAAAGYQQLTSIAAGTTLTVPTGATIAVINVEAQAVRYRDDGTAPTASVGMLLPVGASITYSGPGLAALKFTPATAGTILNVSYYK